MGHVDVDQRPIFGQSLGHGLGPVVPQAVGCQIECLEHAELGNKEIMDGLIPLKRNLVGSEVEHPETVIFKRELLNSIDGVTVEQILPETQLLQSAVHLQHLSVVDRALLSDALVVGGVQVKGPQRTVVPV